MAEETQTRIEKLIPDYGKLNFVNKEEKVGENNELSGMDKKDIMVWRQLESLAHMANEQLEKASDIFQEYLDNYEEVQDMIVVQKALNVINTFGRLLLSLDGERQFVLGILSSYLSELKILKTAKNVIPKKVEKIVEKKTLNLTKAAKHLEICEKWQRGVSTKELAKTYELNLRTVQHIIAKFRKEMQEKDKDKGKPKQIETDNQENGNSKQGNEDFEEKFLETNKNEENSENESDKKQENE